MPLSKDQVRRLKRKAADNTLEVENLFIVAASGDASAVPLLRQLKEKHGWSDTGFEGRTRVVPFGRWANVVCCYLERGHDGLVALTKSKKAKGAFREFCISLLEELRGPESVDALIRIGGGVLRSPRKDEKLAVRLVRALNPQFTNDVGRFIGEPTRSLVREFVHKLLTLKSRETDRHTCLWILAEVGDESSLQRIANLPPSRDRWEKKIANKAIKAIRDRLAEVDGGA